MLKSMAKRRTNRMLLWTTLFTLTVCVILIAMFSGYSHAPGKFKLMLITLILVLFFHYLIGDPIKFVLQAIGDSCCSPPSRKLATDDDANHYNRLDYLKLRLQGLRGYLYITERHRDEDLNIKYRHIVYDLWLYGKYFCIVICLVLITRDEHTFYTTRAVKYLFYKNGLLEIHQITDVYKFIESSLVNPFSPDRNRPDLLNWVHGDQTVLMGVVRLRQLRLTEQHYGLSEPLFTDEKYLPKWELPYEEFPYNSNYWRLFEPWTPMKPGIHQNLLKNFQNYGYYRNYPELQGYVALLARNRQNSLTILKYLNDYKWFNYNTSVIFIDFTLYNADANLLIICTLRVEQTPFGGTIPYAEVASIRLLKNLSYLSTFTLMVLLLYTIFFLQFCKSLLLKLWYNRLELRDSWNQVDLGICLLNMILLTLTIMRELMVTSILDEIAESSKMNFIELRYLSRLHMVINMVMGFLIAIATLRLWKVLQFSISFQLLTRTLFMAWKAVASTAMAICIIIMAFAVAVFVTNGNNSTKFYRLNRSIVSCICFALGFSECAAPEDIINDGSTLGIILYAILVFVIYIMLIYAFASLINDYFTTAKNQIDSRLAHHIGIFQFLCVEYSRYFDFLQRFCIFRKYYKSRNRTVSENIKRDMDFLEKYRRPRESRKSFILEKKITHYNVEMENVELRRNQERMYVIGDILNTQLDILQSMLYSDKDGNLIKNI